MLAEGTSMTVVDDQIGSPTRAKHLANALWRIAAVRDASGLFYFTGAGVASWYDVAMAVWKELPELDVLPAGVTVALGGTISFPRPAMRPAVSVLDKRATWDLIRYTPPHWREGVAQSTREFIPASKAG